MLNKLPPGVRWRGGGGGGATGLLNKGGGSNRLPGLVNNKLWNFHRYFLVHVILFTCSANKTTIKNHYFLTINWGALGVSWIALPEESTVLPSASRIRGVGPVTEDFNKSGLEAS